MVHQAAPLLDCHHQSDRGAMSGAPNTYRPLESITRWLLALLSVSLVIDAIAVVSDLAELSLLDRASNGEFVTFAEAEANDDRQLLVGLVQLGLFLLTGAVFIWWFHRAYKNLLFLGAAPLRYGTGWAIGGWFVPFLNLVRPKQIVNDIWRSSDPQLPPHGAQGSGRPVTALINWWWALFVISAIVGRILSQMGREADSLPELTDLSRMTLLSDVIYVVSAVLGIEVVRRVTARQAGRAQLVFTSTPPGPPFARREQMGGLRIWL